MSCFIFHILVHWDFWFGVQVSESRDTRIWFNSLPDVKFYILFCRLLIFFNIKFIEKFFREYHQSVKQFGSRSGPTFCPNWVQTVCKGYQQKTLVGEELIKPYLTQNLNRHCMFVFESGLLNKWL